MLQQIATLRKLPVSSTNRPEPIPPDESIKPEPEVCPVCGNVEPPFWNIWEGKWFFPNPLSEGCRKCEALALRAKILEGRRQTIIAKYGLAQGQYAHMTFESYEPDPKYPSQMIAKQAALNVLAKWRAGDWSAGLLLYSPLRAVGIGKSHLAIALAREGLMLHDPEEDVLKPLLAIWDMSSYVRAIKASYESGGTDEIIASAAEPTILVMDDLGTEYTKTPSWYQSLMYDIFNARWLGSRATIVTTNVSPINLSHKIGPRAFSRLVALTGRAVEMDGEDYRLKSRRE